MSFLVPATARPEGFPRFARNFSLASSLKIALICCANGSHPKITHQKYRQLAGIFEERARRDSNPRPSDPKSDTLSTELRAQITSCARRSSDSAGD
jgi:hypothetical protein